jgi:hypothetical protein
LVVVVLVDLSVVLETVDVDVDPVQPASTNVRTSVPRTAQRR